MYCMDISAPTFIRLRQKVNIAMDDDTHTHTHTHTHTGWSWYTKVYIYLLNMRYICWGRYRGAYMYLLRYWRDIMIYRNIIYECAYVSHIAMYVYRNVHIYLYTYISVHIYLICISSFINTFVRKSTSRSMMSHTHTQVGVGIRMCIYIPL